MLCRPAKLWQPRQATLTARVCYVQVFYKNRVYRYTQYTIPDELNSFWQMRSLRELHVSHNSLFTLPTSIAQLRSLTYVDASCVTRAARTWHCGNLRCSHFLFVHRYNNIIRLDESLRVRSSCKPCAEYSALC